MKKAIILGLLCLMFLPLAVMAAEDWSDYDNIDNAWDGQKTITNKQFEDTMNAIQAKKKQKEAKQREKAIKKVKGNSLTPQMDAHNENMVNEQPQENLDEGQLLNIPVDFTVDGKIIDRGFYKVLGERKQDGVYILLYQAHSLKAKIKANETNDDFDEKYIQFAKMIPCNSHQFKIIYGSVDFNAFVYLSFVEPEPFFKTE
ncbi:MAG: hypothetical protein NC200_02990 [Candidatus Gastranaerophilales bacterium]|nr:hypothetical protein [Candidatus Gastranaerophilales bacterium]